MDHISTTAHYLIQIAWQKLSGEQGIAILLLWTTVLLAGTVTFVRAEPATWSLRDFIRHLLPSAIFHHPSARADFLFWLSRRLFMPLMVVPLTVSTVAAGHFAYWALGNVFEQPAQPPAPAGPLLLLVFTITMLIAYDLSYYLYHRLQHQIPILWELHKVHHSAQVLIGVTKDRVHPIDEIMNRWWDGLIPGLCYGIWLFFALDPVEVTVFGLNVYMLRNTILMMDFVRHTHLKFSYGRFINAILISPHYHQLHHSIARKDLNKNFGLTLTFWDWMLGTLVVPEPDEDFVFGLTDNEHDDYQSLYRLHILPLQKIRHLLSQVFYRRHELQADQHAGKSRMRYRVEVVTEMERFVALREAWERLWINSGGYIFQSHDWITGWLAGVGGRKDIRPLIALAWDGDRLAGVMPCAVHRRKGLGVLHFAAQIFSDFCDCLIDPEHDRTVLLPRLWAGLKQAGGFDLVILQQIRPNACCRLFFDALTSSGAAWRIEPQERCLRIDNHWPNGAAFFRSLSKKGRNNHTRGKRILTELGGEVRFRVVEPDEPADSMIKEILRLKEIWLRANDPQSPLFGPEGIVLRTIIDYARRSGLAKIFVLECGGKLAAASINFVYGDRMEAYLTAYDAGFERASPGTILIVEYAQWSFDRQLRLVDFLRGEEAFKFRLANAETSLSTVRGAATIVGHVALNGRRWLKRLRQREAMMPPSELLRNHQPQAPESRWWKQADETLVLRDLQK